MSVYRDIWLKVLWRCCIALKGFGLGAYLNAIPEPLYALFATGYLGYTAAREWGKRRQ